MLTSLMAFDSKLIDLPALYISPSLEKNKDEYIDLMFDVSTKGAWAPWIKFFMKATIESCRAASATVDRLLKLQTDFGEAVRRESNSAKAVQLVDCLFERPFVTTSVAAKLLSCTYPTARSQISALVRAEILRELPGIYPKTYYAPAIYFVTRD